jgi:hypothetical protein
MATAEQKYGALPSPEHMEGLEEVLSLVGSEMDSYRSGLDRRLDDPQYDDPMTEEEAGRLMLFFKGIVEGAQYAIDDAKLALDCVENVYREEHSRMTDADRVRRVEWYEALAAHRRARLGDDDA